jgi:FkbM family methyltransferase
MRPTAIPYKAYVAARDARRRWAGEQRLTRLYRLTAGPGDLAFDVGANLGDHVDLLRAIGCRVVAVEPQPKLAADLEERFAADGDVVIVPKALASAPGSGSLTLSDSHVIASMSDEFRAATGASGRFGASQWTETIEVQTTTLDELIAAHGVPAFCKIDVEGFEREVLGGLSHQIGGVMFEFTGEVLDTAIACIERLARLGSTRFAICPPDRHRLPKEWDPAERIIARLRGLPASAYGDIYAQA